MEVSMRRSSLVLLLGLALAACSPDSSSPMGDGGGGGHGGGDGGGGGNPDPGNPDSGNPDPGQPDSGIPGGMNKGPFERIGYFAQWGIYGRAFPVKKLVDNGQADKLTVINYAFGNIDPVNGTCFETTKATSGNGSDPDEGTGGGDQFADYVKSFAADQSVDGVGDLWADPLKGSFRQLQKLKAKYPKLKVAISIGGWTYSKFFSDVSATDASRKKFVSSCIDLYIKGNVPVSDGAGGPGTAAGIFDGIDIDWEWPGSEGHVGNHVSPNDKTNFGLLLTEFRAQLDALGGKHYLLTAFMPANPATIASGIDLPVVFKALDFGNVQGYDFHGPGSDNSWEPHQTNLSGALYQPKNDPSTAKFSGDIALSQYLNAGVPGSKLTLGLPFYGQGWTGVADGGNHGLFQAATGAAAGTYAKGVEDFKVLKTRFPNPMHDTTAIAAYGYDGSNFWSFDDAWAIEQKAAYIRTKGLAGAMVWELDGDDGTLMGALDGAFK
jgi:chitinase